MAAPHDVVDLVARFGDVHEHWAPRIVGEVNGQHLKVVKLLGEFVWHQHDDTDELFVVVDGTLDIEVAGRERVRLRAGECFVVPRGVRHRPVATEECSVLLLEAAGTVNTGDAGGRRTHDAQWA